MKRKHAGVHQYRKINNSRTPKAFPNNQTWRRRIGSRRVIYQENKSKIIFATGKLEGQQGEMCKSSHERSFLKHGYHKLSRFSPLGNQGFSFEQTTTRVALFYVTHQKWAGVFFYRRLTFPRVKSSLQRFWAELHVLKHLQQYTGFFIRGFLRSYFQRGSCHCIDLVGHKIHYLRHLSLIEITWGKKKWRK